MATTVDNGTKTSSSHRQRDVEEVLVDRQLIHGTTALHEALRNGHEEVARYLLSLDPEIATFVSGAGESPLFLAAQSRCELFMSDILQSNRPYSTKGPDGLNVLHAARDCCGKIISILMTQKPHLMRQKDDRGKAAIHYAVEANYWVLIDQMLKADASIALFPEDDGHTPLLRAANSGHGKICEKILEICPQSIEARNRKGQHALHLCKFRDARFLIRIPEILELLNVGDDEGNTPLHLAIKENDYEKAMLLSSSNSVDLGAVNKEGLTALDLCQTDWKNAHKQRLMWLHLTIRGAPHGRLPNEYKVPVGERIEDFNPIINTMALVATLIATVTFAAAFTMPGGYDTSPDNMGVANLAKKAALRAFILSDTIAMLFSIIAVLALGLAVYFEQEMQRRICFISWALINLVMRGSLVAFMSGLFVVTVPKDLWEAISVCIICSTVTLALEISVPFLFSPSIRDLLLIFRRKTHQWLEDLREFTRIIVNGLRT
ncbi:hypothetical protein RHMOL_Rhmol04G0046400 [Rhododendron molle]|uniref:Uncharacterized protein n=1 Tax=Rhododendron molle TaxID=49168 RepID=A0ACC0NXA5_RHOML|nr:hypothetical protein RHMOL_Rhmol04G0046400 [Rhododendron molle]